VSSVVEVVAADVQGFSASYDVFGVIPHSQLRGQRCLCRVRGHTGAGLGA
jgi:hypothetical protein